MKRDKGVGDAGRCRRHNKILFLTRKAARRIRSRYKGGHMDIFPCDERPELWHLGNMPSVVFRGVSGRENVVSLPRSA